MLKEACKSKAFKAFMAAVLVLTLSFCAGFPGQLWADSSEDDATLEVSEAVVFEAEDENAMNELPANDESEEPEEATLAVSSVESNASSKGTVLGIAEVSMDSLQIDTMVGDLSYYDCRSLIKGETIEISSCYPWVHVKDDYYATDEERAKADEINTEINDNVWNFVSMQVTSGQECLSCVRKTENDQTFYELSGLTEGKAVVTVTTNYNGQLQETKNFTITVASSPASVVKAEYVPSLDEALIICPICKKVHSNSGVKIGSIKATYDNPAHENDYLRVDCADEDPEFLYDFHIDEENNLSFSPRGIDKGVGIHNVNVAINSQEQTEDAPVIAVSYKVMESSNPLQWYGRSATILAGDAVDLMTFVGAKDDTTNSVLDFHREDLVKSTQSSNPSIAVAELVDTGWGYSELRIKGLADGSTIINVALSDGSSISIPVKVLPEGSNQYYFTNQVMALNKNETCMESGYRGAPEYEPTSRYRYLDELYCEEANGPFYHEELTIYPCALIKGGSYVADASVKVQPVFNDNGRVIGFKAGKYSGTEQIGLYSVDATTGELTLLSTMDVIVVGEDEPMTHTQQATGDTKATIDFEAGTAGAALDLDKVMRNNLTFVVEGKDKLSGKAQEAVVSVTSDGTKLATMFDAHFESGDVEYQINESGELNMTISLELTDEMKELDGLTVWHVAEDGTMTKMEAKIINGKLVFVTPHFSDYIVTGTPKANNGDEDGDGKDKIIETDKQGKNDGSTSPQTGDHSEVPFVIFGGVAIAALAVALASRKFARRHI